MIRLVYTGLSYLALPAIALRHWWRGRKKANHTARFLERFGYFPKPLLSGVIWIHAVSVGETIAAAPMVRALRESHPNERILVTHTTPGGAAQAESLFGDTVHVSYFPYDLPAMWSRFLSAAAPKVLVLIETELWPNLLKACASRKIPVILANARLSERSAQGYRRFESLTQPMFASLSCVLAQSSADAERLCARGVKEENLHVTGNMKFDIKIPEDLAQKSQTWRERWAGSERAWIAASTHLGEEELILNAWQKIREEMPELKLILVPRHIDRAAAVEAMCVQRGARVVRRSQCDQGAIEADILLVDTLGELLLFYALAQVAFVGGSFVEVGGHNLLEPAALGLPSITGPWLFNFAEISQLLQNAGASFMVPDVAGLVEQLKKLFSDASLREQAAQAGSRVVSENRGSLAKQLAFIEQTIR